MIMDNLQETVKDYLESADFTILDSRDGFFVNDHVILYQL